ncbi:MAG: hypothetical protein KDC36_03710 [Thermoleophilia bacterium]|nr:hypothetical protein [Thermoleophilia bacterium]
MNSVAVRGGPFDLTLDFAIMRGAEDSQAVASLTMSWHHLRLMIEILQSTLEKYEEITGSQVPVIPMESDAVTDSDGGG